MGINGFSANISYIKSLGNFCVVSNVATFVLLQNLERVLERHSFRAMSDRHG